MTRAFAMCFVAAVASGCDGVSASQGLDEPLRVEGAQLFDSPLPGLAPSDPADAVGPRVTSIDLNNPVVYHGASEKRLAGLVDDTAVAVGLGLPTLSDSHWVAPVSGRDPQFPGQLTFVESGSFNPEIPFGIHPFRVVAIDADGSAGRQREQEICVRPPFEDNFSTCDPERAPPAMVISLHWDRDADVDLEIITPSGRRVSPRRPRVDPDDPDSPAIERDSLRSCEPDGMRRESIVFQERPTGLWQFYARLFEGCGFPAVGYSLEIYEALGAPPEAELVKTFERPGQLVTQYDARGPEGTGTFVAFQQFE